MKYYCDSSDLKDIFFYLRNKNFSIFPQRESVFSKILNYLLENISRVKISSLLKNRYKVVLSEQIVENPLILRHLREKDKTILDFGGFESLLALQLSAIGYKVSVLDQRKYPFCHPNLSVYCFDLFDNTLEINEKFDVIISISTIEHLGLGAYDDMLKPDADKRGIEILWKFLKEGGRFMVTVPVGKPTIQRGYRVYNEKRLREIFPCITSIYFFAKEGREGTWHKADADEVENLTYSEPYSQMPVEAIAFIVCDKD